jgi:hypothetical protein
MAAKIENGVITFSSGRTHEVGGCVVGISLENYRVAAGFDYDTIGWTPPNERDEVSHYDLTDTDMIELADLMSEQWTKLRALLVQGSGKD